MRLDTRRETVAASGDLTMDSLQWDAIRPEYPTVPFAGGMAGRITFGGGFDALRLDGLLAGPGGTFEGGGTFVVIAPHLGVRDLDARFASLALVPLRERLPGRALTGRRRGIYDLDTLRAPEADLALELERSLIGGRAGVDVARGGPQAQARRPARLRRRLAAAVTRGSGAQPAAVGPAMASRMGIPPEPMSA